MSTNHYEPTERQLAIATHRMALDEALDTALSALYRAARSIAVLTHKTINDSAYVEGPQGADVASFVNDSLRNIRAAYAIAHPISDNS